MNKKPPKKVKRKANEQASKFGKTANHRPMHRAGSELSWLQSVSLAAGGICWSCAVGRSRAGRCAEQRGPSWAWLRPAGGKSYSRVRGHTANMSGDDETQEQTIADDLVVTKYKMGAEIANRK